MHMSIHMSTHVPVSLPTPVFRHTLHTGLYTYLYAGGDKLFGLLPAGPTKLFLIFIAYPFVTGANVSMLFVLHDRLTLLSELGMSLLVLVGIIVASAFVPFLATELVRALGHAGLPLLLVLCTTTSIVMLWYSSKIARREQVVLNSWGRYFALEAPGERDPLLFEEARNAEKRAESGSGQDQMSTASRQHTTAE